MIVSIHQPQYLPWAGYFYKILKSDVFVIFDTVAYPRGHGFANRNQIKTPRGTLWLTVPVYHGQDKNLAYSDIRVVEESHWVKKHIRSIEKFYQKSAHLADFFGELNQLYESQAWKTIRDVDEETMNVLLKQLNCSTRIVRASDLSASGRNLRGLEYLLAICTELGATQYLSGKGAGSTRYVRPAAFRSAGIELFSYDFTSPLYPQLWGEFIPDLSVLDMLANAGPASRAVIESAGTIAPWT